MQYSTKEITHLRYLADAIAIKPEKTHQFLEILQKVIKESTENAYFSELLEKHLEKKLPEATTHQNIFDLGQELAKSKEPLVRRMGEILLWGLNNRNKVPKHNDGEVS